MFFVTMLISLWCLVFACFAAIYAIIRNVKLEKENKVLRRKVHRYEYREKQEQEEKKKQEQEEKRKQEFIALLNAKK